VIQITQQIVQSNDHMWAVLQSDTLPYIETCPSPGQPTRLMSPSFSLSNVDTNTFNFRHRDTLTDRAKTFHQKGTSATTNPKAKEPDYQTKDCPVSGAIIKTLHAKGHLKYLIMNTEKATRYPPSALDHNSSRDRGGKSRSSNRERNPDARGR